MFRVTYTSSILIGSLAFMTTTATRTSLEKLSSRTIIFFAIILSRLLCIMWPNFPGAVFVGAAFKVR